MKKAGLVVSDSISAVNSSLLLSACGLNFFYL